MEKWDHKKLENFLKSKGYDFKIFEFEDDVKLSIKASKFVPIEKIVKSLVFLDNNNEPFVAILPAYKKADFKKLKEVLKVKDVRLANHEEVLKYSGYEVGAVPPLHYKNIERVVLDKEVLEIKKVFAGGGDVNKLIEIDCGIIIKENKPIISEIGKSIK